MANNKKISQLNSLSNADNGDLFAIVDTSAFETKKITRYNLFSSPGPIGSVTPNTGEFSVLTVGGVPINEFSIDGTLSGDSDTAVPTEKAVKSYVDAAVGDAVKLNIVHTSSDTTATIGDVVLVNTSSGDVNVQLEATGTGKIVVYKNSNDTNKININPASGSMLDNSFAGTTIDYGTSSLEFVCDGTNFYTI